MMEKSAVPHHQMTFCGGERAPRALPMMVSGSPKISCREIAGGAKLWDPSDPTFRGVRPKIKKIVRNESLLIEYCIIHRYCTTVIGWLRRKSRHSPSPSRRAAKVAPDPTSLDGLCRPVVSASGCAISVLSTHWIYRSKRCFLFARRVTLRASTVFGPARIEASTRR
jgi:hypothetical protein